MLSRKNTVAAAATALLAACSAGPDYRRPDAPVPAAFKEAAESAGTGWAPGTPQDHADRGAWWSVYGDPVLDGLERQVEVSNQTLKASEAAYRQAMAALGATRAGLFPTLSVTPSVERSQAAHSAASGSKASSRPPVTTTYDLTGAAGWEIDLWGRVRRAVENGEATAQASAGDLASARLSAQASLAASYFQLRVQDELKRLLDASVAAYTQSLQIARNQYAAGIASRADVAQAETQLKTTQAQAINVGLTRAELEHAIAVLVGKPPADFAIAPATAWSATVPAVPAGIPSALLQRRPDIAAAERRVAAANAQIGVAAAAYYPQLTLSGSLGYAQSAVAGLLHAANRMWSVGPSLAQTLFDGGLRDAQLEQARAAWEQSVAQYRQSVLTAFQQVEDQLAAQQVLERQAAVQAQAVASAREAERLVLNQYKAGTVAYTNVVIAQTAALANEQTALTIVQNRISASVSLIQALGGGWDAAELDTPPAE